VAEEEEREEREDNDDDDDDDCDVNAPTAEMPTTIRLGVANFIFILLWWLCYYCLSTFVFCGFVLWTARAGGRQCRYGDKWAGAGRFYEDSPTPDAVTSTSAFMVKDDGLAPFHAQKKVVSLRSAGHKNTHSLHLFLDSAILGL